MAGDLFNQRGSLELHRRAADLENRLLRERPVPGWLKKKQSL